MGVWQQFGRGGAVWERRGGMGKKKKEKQWKRVSAYNSFFRWNHRRITSIDDSIGDSVGESATSLYGYLSLNPSVIPSVKLSDVTTLLHISRQTIYLVGEPSVYTDGNIPSVYTDRVADGFMPSVYTDRF